MLCPTCNASNTPQAQHCKSCGTLLGSFTLAEGTVLNGRYRLGKVLGQGGFGITYEASDSLFNRNVALKELVPPGAARYGTSLRLQTTSQGTDFEQLKKSFLKEGQTLAQFKHDHIVSVLDLFEANGTAYIAMEYLEGESLQSRIDREGSIDPQSVIRYARQALAGLSVVHGASLLHRDLKPDNLIITPNDQIVLIDFGSARDFAGKTLQHTRLVTPGYAPLEQYSTQARFGPYTDLYALGATLYHALTGAPPPPSTDRVQGMAVTPLPQSVPAPLGSAIMQALELRIDQRFQSTAEMLAALEPSKAPSPQPTPRTAPPTQPAAPKPVPPTQSAPPTQPVPSSHPTQQPNPTHHQTQPPAPTGTPARKNRLVPALIIGVVLTVGVWQGWSQNVFGLRGAAQVGGSSPAPVTTQAAPLRPSAAASSASSAANLRYEPFGPDRDCGDFATQREAQVFFAAAGGPANDRHRLDRDGDGRVCETLP